MTRPGDLLSRRAHTTLPADEDAEDEDDAEDDDGGDEPDYAPTGFARADEELGALLADARGDELDLPTYQRYWQRLRGNVIGAVQTMWQLHGPNEAGAYHAGAIVHSGQQVGSKITQIYAKDALGVSFTPFDPGPGIIERPGIDKVAEYSRPIREKSLGAQLRRLDTLANTDLQLSKTRTLFSAFDEDMTVNRAPIRIYRRETTSENPCALCEIASDQVYFTTDLMPIHDNCMCDVEMSDAEDIDEHKARYHHIGFVDSLIDAGEQVKALTSLADADADADEYQNLIKIEQHGELGPVIRWAGQKFTGPKDLPVPMGIRPVPTISGPGLGHEARLQRNAERTMQIRRQRGHDLHYAQGHGGLSTYLPPTTKVTKPIVLRPKPVETAKVIPIRPAPKVVDFDHDSISDLVAHMADKHRDVVPPESWAKGGWDDPQYNEEAKREVLKAADEMLTRYPDLKIGRISIGDLDPGVAGETTASGKWDGTTESIVISSKMMREDPAVTRRNWRFAYQRGFFFTDPDNNPYRQLVFHEYGHAINNRGGRGASHDAGHIFVEEFKKSGRATPSPVKPAVDPKWSVGKRAKVMGEYFDALDQWMKDNEKAFTEWLSEKDRVSGYSMIDGEIPGRRMVDGKIARLAPNPGEAIAEAFANTEIRGAEASDVSRALTDRLIETYRGDWPTPRADLPTAASPEPKQSAVERLRQLTLPKPDWTDTDMAKEDNFSRDKNDNVILSDEQRDLARELATSIWQKGAQVEPGISAAALSSVKHNGGFLSGFDFRQKTGPSLYRKIQADAIEIAQGKPVTDDMLITAADGIKDAVRYTAIFPEEAYWERGTQLQRALEQLGAKTIKDPVGIPLNGYRGRNFAFTLNGMPFEMQVNTELGVAIKDEAHQIYNVSRKLKNALEAKGIDPLADPAYRKMLDDMQAKWDTIPIRTGTPVVQTEKDVKSGDPSKVLYVTDHDAYYGRTVPGHESPLGSAEMLGRERVPSTKYGMNWLPDSPEPRIVAPARTLTDEDWDHIPVQLLPQGTPLEANEGTLKKKSIDKVVGGKEPFREGYYIKLLRTDDGKLHIVDGHTRVAMYHALGKDMPVKVIDQATVNDLQSHDIYDIAKANGGITIDLGGHQPEDGYAYAPRKDTERRIAADKFSDQDIEDYINEHRALLMKPGNNFGCWYEDGYYFLDVSRVGDASAETIEEAQKNEQLGVFDLKTFDTVTIGREDDQGRYHRVDEAASIHNRHQEQVARDAESRSAASDGDVSGGVGAEAATERSVAPPTAPPTSSAEVQQRLDDIAAKLDELRMRPRLPVPFPGDPGYEEQEAAYEAHAKRYWAERDELEDQRRKLIGLGMKLEMAEPSERWPNLTGEQDQALQRYIVGTEDNGPGSYALNNALRWRPGNLDTGEKSDIALIDSAIAASKLTKRTAVRRIITGQTRDIRAEILSHASDPSYRLTEPGFMSTSRQVKDSGPLKDWIEFYAKASGQPTPDISKSVVLQIDLPKGAHALDIGEGLKRGGGLTLDGHDYASESEVLLPRDTQWRIGRVTADRDTGVPVVHLEPVTQTVQAVPKAKRKRREVIREGAGGPFTPPHNLIPASGELPDGVKWLDQKKMVANIIARYDDCIGDNAWIKQAGLQWYPSAHEWVAKLVANTGKDWSMAKASAVVAQFSENASWAANMMRATNYFNGIRRGAFKGTFKRVDAIVASDDPMSAMRGPKIHDFGHAILGDDPNAVAVDRWMARVALGTDDKDAADKIKGRVGGYDAIKAAYIAAARQVGVSPRDLQAISWVHAVPPDETVEEFKETEHWNFHS